FFFSLSVHLCVLHSFPTRRSSDLVSVGALFLAGIMPGAVMTVLMMLTVAYFAHKNGWGGDIAWEWMRVRKAFVEMGIVIAFPLADRKSTRLNSSHRTISYAVFCLK